MQRIVGRSWRTDTSPQALELHLGFKLRIKYVIVLILNFLPIEFQLPTSEIIYKLQNARIRRGHTRSFKQNKIITLKQRC